MAFGETIAAEPLDLLKTARGEFGLVTACHHAADHLGFEILHRADVAERRHGTAQQIGLHGGKIGRRDRQPHRLFLEQRHPQRLAEHGLQLVGVVRRRRRREHHFLAPLAAAQIGVDHVALDRAWPDDRHLDGEVIKFTRAQARQHVDLRPAFDLKNPDTVALAQHVIDIRSIIGNALQAILATEVRRNQRKGAADARQHAQRQHIDLHQPQRVDIVLVPFDEGAVGHRGIVDRHGFIEAVVGQHKAADVLRQVARKPQDLRHQPRQPGDFGGIRIETAFGEAAALHMAGKTAPDGAGQPRRHILRQAEHLADLAHRAARAIMDHGRDDAGTVAAIAVIDILHHLLAAFMLEINVDIGRFAAFFGNEARKQQVVLHRIDGGDAEHIADRRIRRRSAPLAQDAAPLRKGDDIVDGEEIGGVFGLGDDGEFMGQQCLDLCRHAIGPARSRFLPGQRLQPALRAVPGRDGLVGIFIAEFVEAKVDPRQNIETGGDGLRTIGEQSRHFGRRFQMAFGVGRQPPPGIDQPGLFADAGQHIVEMALIGGGIERRVDRDNRHPDGEGGAAQRCQPAAVAPGTRHGQRQPDAPRRQHRQVGKAIRASGDEQQVVGAGAEIGEMENAIALDGAAVAERQQPAQPPPAGAVDRIGDDVRRGVGKDQPGADDEPEIGEPGIAHRHVGAHDTGDAVTIGNADAGMAEGLRHQHHVSGRRRAGEKAEMRRRRQFGKAGGGQCETVRTENRAKPVIPGLTQDPVFLLAQQEKPGPGSSPG